MLKDDTLYFPIYNLQKDQNKKEKYITITKSFGYENNETNVINRINKYYVLNCLQNTKVSSNTFYNAKEVKELISKPIIGQVIDSRYKCRFILVQNTNKGIFLFPVYPSGCLDKIPIYKSDVEYVNTLSSTMKFIIDLNVNIVPTGIVYNQQIRDKYIISGLYLQENIIVPVTTIRLDETEIKRFAKEYKIKNLMIIKQTKDDIIDREILKGPDNIIVDNRIMKVNKVEYTEESYARFRLELSEYISNNPKYGIELDNASDNSVSSVKQFLTKIIKDIVSIIPRPPKLDNYMVTNFRQLCKLDQKCSHYHCGKVGKTCQLQLTIDMLKDFILRISNELVYNVIKRQEILRRNGYLVPDIYDYDFFSSKQNEKIFKTSNLTLDTILKEIYGENNLPIIGKKKLLKVNNITELYPPRIFGKKIEQLVKKDSGLYRSIINGFYWIKNPLLELEYRNLGYESSLQNDIINLFKGRIINWFSDENNINKLHKDFDIKYIPQLKEKLVSQEPLESMYKYELYILSLILNCRINVYNQYDEIVLTYGKDSDVIEIKYEIYNAIISKFYVIYSI
jgi:hypothetical protein